MLDVLPQEIYEQCVSLLSLRDCLTLKSCSKYLRSVTKSPVINEKARISILLQNLTLEHCTSPGEAQLAIFCDQRKEPWLNRQWSSTQGCPMSGITQALQSQWIAPLTENSGQIEVVVRNFSLQLNHFDEFSQGFATVPSCESLVVDNVHAQSPLLFCHFLKHVFRPKRCKIIERCSECTLTVGMAVKFYEHVVKVNADLPKIEFEVIKAYSRLS